MSEDDKRDIQEGFIYWCETARSNIGTRFSDKARRPVLVVARLGEYVAVYPCSSYRGDMGASEWIGEVFGDANTHLIFGTGLYYAPRADLQLPGLAWPEWATWKRIEAVRIAADLHTLWNRFGERLSTPTAGRSDRPAERLTTSLESLLPGEIRERLSAPPASQSSPPPPMPPVTAPALPEPDEFVRAVEAMRPEAIDKPLDPAMEAASASPTSRKKARKHKGRRQ